MGRIGLAAAMHAAAHLRGEFLAGLELGGVPVATALSLRTVDREEGGGAALAAIGLALHPVFTAAELRGA